jgi:chemotaxis protein methyltransferase CheR
MVHDSDVNLFRQRIADCLGLQFDDGKQDYLAATLAQRIAESRSASTEGYLSRLEPRGRWREEWRALAATLTVGETYFFRNSAQFRALLEAVVPALMRERSAERSLRILSAGCASGEEAFSLAIALKEQVPESFGWRLRIRAIDLNARAIERAVKGSYSAWSLRDTSSEVLERYFETRGKEYILAPEIRQMVEFEERNLVENDPAFWTPNAFDIVFCRNVTMYFPPTTSQRVVQRIAAALSPGGYLFLGHAETLRGVSNDFHLRHTHDTFYYQKKGNHELEPESFPNPALPHIALATETGVTWFDAIQRASAQIARLADRGARQDGHDSSSVRDPVPLSPLSTAGSSRAAQMEPTSHQGWNNHLALELLRQERFADALELLERHPPESRLDPDTQLLKAVLLINSGKLETAQDVCEQILQRDELNAGAHYLCALAREQAGAASAAVEHDEMAAYLDPAFAMPRVHLGLMARRNGELEVARIHFERALGLLAREDTSRILLFGGGFTREALVRLCRAELLAAGGDS